MKNIELDLLDLPDGTVRIICPVCQGGSSKEKSLAVTKDGENVVWYCHRASCSEKGGLGKGKVRNKNFQPTQKSAVDRDIRGYSRQPINDNEGGCWGWIHRANNKGVIPKTINNYSSDWCGLHFPKRITKNYALAVEDRASAVCMAEYFPCFSLQGVHLNDAKVEYLLTQGITHVIIGLDEDATNVALKLQREWWIVKDLVYLDKDVKDMRLHEILFLANDLYERVT